MEYASDELEEKIDNVSAEILSERLSFINYKEKISQQVRKHAILRATQTNQKILEEIGRAHV